MVKPLKFLTILFLASWALFAQAKISATATVDRNTITVDDSLTLTVRINDAGTYKTPNLSALEKDFEVAGTNQSSRRSLINGRSSSTTEWIITLYPKREGMLIIPSIKVNDAKTEPIAVQVEKAFTLPAGQLDVVFLESSLSTTEAYLQQQILLNVLIYQSIQLDGQEISDLKIEGATTKVVGQNAFYRTVKGVRHRVQEINYAIFPEKAGTLQIPEQVFSGRKISPQDFWGRGGKLIRRKSEPHKIEVKAPPADYKGDLWLPAANLTLQETWSSDPQQLRAGDSITRSITIKADGVTAAQLPPINFASKPGFKLYPDKPETNNSESAKGISATRIDSTAMIATQAGKLTLPAIEIHWWDTTSQSEKVASIPAKTIDVLPSLEQQSIASNAIDHSPQQATTDSEKTVVSVVNPFWMIVSFVVGGLWIITALAYWRLQQRLKQLTKPEIVEAEANTLSEKKAYQQLQKVCRNNQQQHIRKTLISWGRSYWPHCNIQTLSDIASAANNPQLKNLLLQFDNSLYGATQDSSAWNAESLLNIVNEIRKQKPNAQAETSPLPELYRA